LSLRNWFSNIPWMRWVVRIGSLLLLVLFWQLLVDAGRANLFEIPGIRLSDIPTPVEVWGAFLGSLHTTQIGPVITYDIFTHSTASIGRVMVGLTAACIVGIPLGLIVGYFKHAEDFLSAPIEILRQIPPIAWIPIAIFILTAGKSEFIVFIGVVFPVILNVIEGVRSTPPALLDAAKTLGAGRGELLRKVVVPHSLPYIITGTRIGLGIGWMCIVAAEMVIQTPRGLGYYVWSTGFSAQYPQMVSGMIVIGALGFTMNSAIRMLEGRLITWR